MKRTPTSVDPAAYPAEIRHYLAGAKIYDSSCSREARVLFLDRDEGYYLKSAPKGTLRTEAEMTRFFASKGLAPAVLAYLPDGERDLLLTVRAGGEDCTHADYLSDPKRLTDTLAELLRALHETDPTGCPVPDHTSEYLGRVRKNFLMGEYDLSYLPAELSRFTAEEAYAFVSEHGAALETKVLLHGDYCLPNVMLDGWRFSSFIDVGNGGVGDRHVDLFWGAWTLNFNLKTDRYRERFFDAYGRDLIDPDRLLLVGAAEVFG